MISLFAALTLRIQQAKVRGFSLVAISLTSLNLGLRLKAETLAWTWLRLVLMNRLEQSVSKVLTNGEVHPDLIWLVLKSCPEALA